MPFESSPKLQMVKKEETHKTKKMLKNHILYAWSIGVYRMLIFFWARLSHVT